MKSAVRIISAILLFIFVICCAGPVHDQLESLDRAIEQSPDSVLAELEQIDTTRLRNDRDRAYHALLMTQAKYKSDDLEAGDSTLVEKAVRFYSNTPNTLEYVKAFFYRAKWMQLYGNTKNAMENVFPAYDMAIKLNNSEWVARTSEMIADIYSSNFNNERVDKYTRETILAYDRALMSDNKNYAICDYALNLSRMEENERAIEILDSVVSIAVNNKPENSPLASYARAYLFSIYLRKGNLKKAEETGNLILFSDGEEALSKFELLEFAELYLKKDQISDARYFLDLASRKPSNIEGDAAEVNTNVELSVKEGDYKSAYQHLDSLFTLQKEVINDVFASSSTDIEREYFQNKSEKANKRNRELFLIIGLITFFSVVIIIAVIVIARLRLRLRRFQLNEKIREIFNLNDTIDNLNESKEQMTLLNRSLKKELTDYKKQFEELSDRSILRDINYSQNNKFLIRLIEKYVEVKDQKKSDKLGKRIGLEINKIGDRDNLKNQEKLINKKLDNIIVRLREQCDFLKPSEIDFILFQTCGLPPRILCAVLEIPQSTFYTLRVRIKEKIAKSSVRDRDAFLKFLDMLNQ